MVTLIANDAWSKWFVAVPVARRGGADALRHMTEALTTATLQLGYSEINVKADNEGVCRSLKIALQKMRGAHGLSTTLLSSVPHDHESNGLAERAVQTVRRHANCILDEVRVKTELPLSHEHPLMSWAMRHSAWLLNRFHRSSATGKTPYEFMTGQPYRGELVPFASTIMVKRLRPKRKGDRLWTFGVFLGKTESGMWLTFQSDGIHASRSARPVGEAYDAKAISSVNVFTWSIKNNTLGSRVLPQKRLVSPQIVLPAVAAGEERKSLEDEVADEAASDPPTSDEEKARRDAEGMLEEFELVHDEHDPLADMVYEHEDEGGEVPEEAKMDRESRPDFECVGSPSKIPRTRVELPRFGPGASSSVMRAERMPDNDERSDEEEDCFAGSEAGDFETEDEWSDEEQQEEVQVLPESFFSEEAGPPQLAEEDLEIFDDAAAGKEVSRLTKMGVIEEVPMEQEENKEVVWLTTKLVFDWRFRESENVICENEITEGQQEVPHESLKPRRCWQRRARLVAREYNNSKREDVFSPATSPSLTKLIPILALANRWSIWSLDIKDAFLQVPQKRPVHCKIPRGKGSQAVHGMEAKCWRLGRVLPGQRDASLLWSEFCAELLQQEGYEKSIANPALFRLIKNGKVVSVCIVHVDDLQVAGKAAVVKPVLEALAKKVKLQVEGPFLTEEDYRNGFSKQSVRFLKRRYSYEDGKLFVRPDTKYVTKLLEKLHLGSRREKATPAAGNVQNTDETKELDENKKNVYRSCVGILLYLAQDRPDIQYAVRNLATGMKAPTQKKQKELEHCALYLKKTAGYAVCYTAGRPGTATLQRSKNLEQDSENENEKSIESGSHLVEVFSDADWAGNKSSRKSVSGGVIFLDGQYAFSYSRTQKTVALSSGESEYYALTGAVAEGIGIREAVEFLSGKAARMKAYTDSSAARGIVHRQGVGRIKHLATRMLWLQEVTRNGLCSVKAVSTVFNPADLGTKPLNASRMKLLLNILQVHDDREAIGREERMAAESTATVRRLTKVSGSRLGLTLLSAFGFAVESAGQQEGEFVARRYFCMQLMSFMFGPFSTAQEPPQELQEVEQEVLHGQSSNSSMKFSHVFTSMPELEMFVPVCMAVIVVLVTIIVYLAVNQKKEEKPKEKKPEGEVTKKKEEEDKEKSSQGALEDDETVKMKFDELIAKMEKQERALEKEKLKREEAEEKAKEAEEDRDQAFVMKAKVVAKFSEAEAEKKALEKEKEELEKQKEAYKQDAKEVREQLKKDYDMITKHMKKEAEERKREAEELETAEQRREEEDRINAEIRKANEERIEAAERQRRKEETDKKAEAMRQKEQAKKAQEEKEAQEKAAQEKKAQEEKEAQERKAQEEKEAQERKAQEEKKKAKEKKAQEEKEAQERKAQEEKEAQERKAQEEKEAQERKAQEEKEAQEKEDERNEAIAKEKAKKQRAKLEAYEEMRRKEQEAQEATKEEKEKAKKELKEAQERKTQAEIEAEKERARMKEIEVVEVEDSGSEDGKPTLGAEGKKDAEGNVWQIHKGALWVRIKGQWYDPNWWTKKGYTPPPDVAESSEEGKEEGGAAGTEEERKEKEEEQYREPPQRGEKGSKNAKGRWNVVTFTDCGWIWEYCKDTNEYRAVRLDQKGSAQVKGARIKGAEDWNLVTKHFKKTGRWESPTEIRRERDEPEVQQEGKRGRRSREQEDWQQESWHQQQDWYADDGWSQNYWEPDYAYYHYAPKGKYQGKGKWKYGGGGKKGW